MGGGTTPLTVIYYVTLCGGYIQTTNFPKAFKIGTLVVSKLWMSISFSNQICLEHVRALSYSPQKNIFKGVSHAPIRDHLTFILRGFVIRSQIFNLTPALSFDHNSCILGLNEQCKGTLGICTSRPFQWYPGGPIWCFFLFFQPRF